MFLSYLTSFNFHRWHYPEANDFGSEVIPMATKDFNVQVES